MDHVYSKRPCLDKENVLPGTIDNSAASSANTQQLSSDIVRPALSSIDCNEALSVVASDTAASVQVPVCIMLDPLSQELSSSQATISDSLSQFVAAQNRDDKALICSLRKRIRRLTRQLKLAREQSASMKTNLSKFLNADQIDSLNRKAKSRGMRWSNSTVKKALQIRCATGVKDYGHLIREGFPLPCRHIELFVKELRKLNLNQASSTMC